EYAGRTSPVVYTGEMTSWVANVSGRTTDHDLSGEETADVDRLTLIAQLPDRLHMLRTPDGLRRYGALTPIEMPREMATGHPDGWNGIWGYSFTLTEAQ